MKMDALVCTSVYILFLSILFHSGEAIKCYECNSKRIPGCADPFNATAPGVELVDCVKDKQHSEKTILAIQEVANLMTKLGQAPAMDNNGGKLKDLQNIDSIPMACQKMDIEVLGEVVTGRGCSANKLEAFHPCDALKIITDENIILHSCSLCETDSCNGAGHLSISLYTLVALIGTIFFVAS